MQYQIEGQPQARDLTVGGPSLPLPLYSYFVRKLGFICLLLGGCSRQPDWYAPPVQRKPLTGTEFSGLGHFVAMNDPQADSYIVRDVAKTVEGGTWRWTGPKPELRFFLQAIHGLSLSVDFAIAEITIKDTGPVTLSFFINGHLLDKVRYEEHGNKHFQKPVPPEFLKANADNSVVIEPDKVWISKLDNAQLGFILTRAGFVQ